MDPTATTTRVNVATVTATIMAHWPTAVPALAVFSSSDSGNTLTTFSDIRRFPAVDPFRHPPKEQKF